MLLRTLGASLLGNMLIRKGMLIADYGNKEGNEMLRAGYGPKGSSMKDLQFKKKKFHPIL